MSSVTTTQGTSQHTTLGSRQTLRIVGAAADAACSPPPPQTKTLCTSPRLSRNADFVLDFLPVSPSTALYGETKYALTVKKTPGTPSQTSAAAAFFARAAQKLNLTSLPHRRKRLSTEGESVESAASLCERGSCCESVCGRSFRKALLRQPPPVPPALLRRIGVREVTGVGKVKVMLKVCRNFVPDITEPRVHCTLKNVTTILTPCADEVPSAPEVDNVRKSTSVSFFSIDARKKQVTLFDPVACGGTSAPEDRRVGVAAPKMFTFDAIFTQDDSQDEICANSLSDLIHAVINGMDGCLFCFGHSKLGKTTTMVGTPDSTNTLGIIPCAIAWLFRSINDQKQKTGARFSVRVSAVEVVGPCQQLNDLLADHATDSEQSPGAYLRDDPLFGTTLQNQSELRVPTAEKAAFYLDAALNNRTNKEEMKESHMLYTLHVYQYSVAGKGGVAGGRSRLHLIDLGSCERGKANSGIPLSGLGNVLLAIFNGQKHLPYRDHKITQLLKECLSSLTCHAAMIVHVSPYAQHYYDTLATIQLASRIHRMRRRKIKLWTGSTGSGGSSGEEASRLQTQEHGRSTGSSDIDPSSSEQSADTVIYVGPSDEATDGEHPPVYIPSLNSGDNRCAMSKALRGSGAEHRPTMNSSRSHMGKTTHSSSLASPKLSCDYFDDRNNIFIRCSSNKTNAPNSLSKTLFSHMNTCKSSSGCISVNVSNNKSLENGNSVLSGTVNKASCASNSNTAVPGSDEQWIDGPRISKLKVAEAWNLLKDNYKKKETWIDGPMQVSKGHPSMSYGFMDNHKKNMIRKWVENQTVQIQKQTGKSVGGQSCAPSVTAQAIKDASQVISNIRCTTENKELKELTAARHSDTEGSGKEISSMGFSETNISERFLLRDMALLRLADGGVDKAKQLSDTPYSTSDTSTNLSGRNISIKRDQEQSEVHGSNGNSTSIEETPPCNKINADMVLKSPFVESQPLSSGPGEFDEIIEISEPYEPVPMQDCSLQVTEEDIAICMGEVENPLPEVDQETLDEHPLRILSEENLTIVSTFTDSLSVTTDVEMSLPSHQLGIGLSPNHSLSTIHSFDWGQLSENAVSHTDLSRSFSEETKAKHELNVNTVHMSETNHAFSQLSKLHEMYRHKLARVNATKMPDKSFQPVSLNSSSRYQSRSLIDILQSQCYPKSDFRYIDTNTLHSEPTYNRSIDRVTLEHSKICNNCKINFTSETNDILPHTSKINRQYPLRSNVNDDVDYHSCVQIPDSSNISSLRHPDGASNPNLTEDAEKRLQDESSILDHKIMTRNKGKHSEVQNISSKKGKSSSVVVRSVKDDDIPPDLPPPLFVPTSSRLQKRFFTKGCTGLKSMSSHICPEGCDSGPDSSIFRLPKGDVLYFRFSGKARPGCESSGYESIIRDSESSSFESSQDSDHSSRAEFRNSGNCISVTGGDPRTNSYKRKSSLKVPVLQYFKEDVDRLERRWMEIKSGRIKDLQKEQEDLKKELAAAKSRLLIPRDRWSYELHVETSMDHRHPSFVEALQRETEILRKRVEACKSHILMATCFDSVIKSTED